MNNFRQRGNKSYVYLTAQHCFTIACYRILFLPLQTSVYKLNMLDSICAVSSKETVAKVVHVSNIFSKGLQFVSLTS